MVTGVRKTCFREVDLLGVDDVVVERRMSGLSSDIEVRWIRSMSEYVDIFILRRMSVFGSDIELG